MGMGGRITNNGGNFRRAESARSWTILRAFFFVGRSWKRERRERSDSPARHRGPTEGVTLRVHRGRRHTSRGSRFDTTTKILSDKSGRCETLFLSTGRHLPGRNMWSRRAAPSLPSLSHLPPDRFLCFHYSRNTSFASTTTNTNGWSDYFFISKKKDLPIRFGVISLGTGVHS
jgi:hypothetical protein